MLQDHSHAKKRYCVCSNGCVDCWLDDKSIMSGNTRKAENSQASWMEKYQISHCNERSKAEYLVELAVKC